MTDRDYGDESDYQERHSVRTDLYVIIGTAPSRTEPVELLENSIVKELNEDDRYRRSYLATYRCGDTIYRTETILGFDNFAATSALAAGLAREGEVVVGLRELI